MPKPSKKTIEPLLTELAELKLKALAIEMKRDNALASHKEAFEKKAAPIDADAKGKLEPINARLKVLIADIETQLLAGVDEKTEKIALAQVQVDIETNRVLAVEIARTNKGAGKTLRTSENDKPLVTATAEVVAKEGAREIDAKKFFEFVEASKRDAGFWNCLTVKIAESVKFLGAAIDKLATKPKKWSVSIGMKA